MRFFYIICLVLSSVFTYKSATADEQLKLAFFTPNNAFQDNMSVNDIKDMQPRYGNQVIDNEGKNSSLSQSPAIKSVTNSKDTSTSVPTPKTAKKTIMPIKNVISEVKVSEPLKEEEPVTELPPEIKEKLKKYSLDDEKTFDVIKNLDSNKLTKNKNQNINTLLARIPAPDFSAPKFKQIYANHGMALRALYRTGRLPYNQEQEETLAKANSIRRQVVE